MNNFDRDTLNDKKRTIEDAFRQGKDSWREDLEDFLEYLKNAPTGSKGILNIERLSNTNYTFENIEFGVSIRMTNVPPGHGNLLFKNCSFSDLSIAKCSLTSLSLENCTFESLNIRTTTLGGGGLSIEGSAQDVSINMSGLELIGNLSFKDLSIIRLEWLKKHQGEFLYFGNCSFNSLSNNFLNRSMTNESIKFESCIFHKKTKIANINPSAQRFALLDCTFKQPLEIDSLGLQNGGLCRIDNCRFHNLTVKKMTQNTEFEANEIEAKTIEFIESHQIMHHLIVKNSARILVYGCNSDLFHIKGQSISQLVLTACQEMDLHVVGVSIGDFQASSTFTNVNIENCRLNSFDASDCTFKKAVRLTNNVFETAPKFFGTRFEHKNVTFLNSSFSDVSSPHAESAYRELKHEMANIRNDVEGHNFSGLEQNSRCKQLYPFHPEWFFSWLYCLANNYGRSLWIPLLWVMLFHVGFTAVYENNMQFIELNSKLENTRLHKSFEKWTPWEKANYVSIQNSVGPLRYLSRNGLIMAGSVDGERCFFAQAFITTILWFLFFAGIRRRFKTH